MTELRGLRPLHPLRIACRRLEITGDGGRLEEESPPRFWGCGVARLRDVNRDSAMRTPGRASRTGSDRRGQQMTGTDERTEKEPRPSVMVCCTER
jgi:hypothetical protein